MKTARDSRRANPRESAAAPRAATALSRLLPLPPLLLLLLFPPHPQKSSETAPATAAAAEEARRPQETAPEVYSAPPSCQRLFLLVLVRCCSWCRPAAAVEAVLLPLPLLPSSEGSAVEEVTIVVEAQAKPAET